jgi:molybdenum cofactor cytidylyltransferase
MPPCEIGALVLAAGQSRRMGRPKLPLPWQGRTVIGQVVHVLVEAGVEPIVVVTGAARPQVEAALAGWAVWLAHNPAYADGEMIRSLQVGLESLVPTSAQAALVVLGDQPQMQPQVVQAVLEAGRQAGPPGALVVPSYRLRRGHPWLAPRRLWPELLALQPPATLRTFLNAHQSHIHYLPLETDSILQDLDTPADYEQYQPSK